MEHLVCLIPFPEEEKARLVHMAKDRCSIAFVQREDVEYPDQMARATILLGDPEAEDLLYCKNLKLMQTTWAGVSQFVGCPCFSEGAVLCNMTGGYGPVIAEYALGMVLTLCRHFPQYARLQQSGTWEHIHYSKSLEDATVLILGAGDIGTELAKRMRPLVKRIIGIRRVKRAVPPMYDEIEDFFQLDALLPQADIVVACLPDTPQTRGLLDGRRLRLMKKDAVLVNVGRGTLIVEADLTEIMQQGHLFGVGLDVAAVEPLPEDHPFWSQERLLLTPHVSGNDFSPDSPSQHRIWSICLENIENYLHARPLKNVVDINTGYRKI